MTHDELQHRVATFHTPYHRAIEVALEQLKAEFGYALLIDAHSMPSVGKRNAQGRTTRRADVVPGDVDGRSCSSIFTDLVEDHFQNRGFSVSRNTPYKGGWITRNFGAPESGTHAIQIEINRDLYMNEKSFQRNTNGMERLNEACCSLIEQLGKLEIPT